MNYWSWWVSGVALSSVMLLHWILVGRMMAVSGRVTNFVDRLRHGAPAPAPEMDQAALIAALQAATAEEFTEPDGEAPPIEMSPPEPAADPGESPVEAASTLLAGPRPLSQHVIFFGMLIVGGLVSSLMAGNLEPTMFLHGDTFHSVSKGDTMLSTLMLLGGGVLVGFGTRMSGGCTSGHGLCGTSRMQSGSLLATAAFFGAGIATSFALGAL